MKKLYIDTEVIGVEWTNTIKGKVHYKHRFFKVVNSGVFEEIELLDYFVSKTTPRSSLFSPLETFYTHFQDTIKYWTITSDTHEPLCINTFKAENPNHGFHRNDGTIG